MSKIIFSFSKHCLLSSSVDISVKKFAIISSVIIDISYIFNPLLSSLIACQEYLLPAHSSDNKLISDSSLAICIMFVEGYINILKFSKDKQ